MGFFSSITKPFKKAFNAVKDVVGGVVDTVAPFAGAAGDVVGGLLSSNSTQDANAANIALAREQLAYQKELAQNQVQWRVEDAKKAGLHPMAALGLSSMSYSPVSSNVMPTDYSYLGEMGQNINRAVMQGKTARERQQALDRQDQFDRIALRKANADADYAETLAASERLKLQRELFPPTPAVNGDKTLIGGQNDAPPYSAAHPYGKDLFTLFTLARHGDTFYEVPHPDIADSITETEWKNILASIDAEAQVQNGSVKPPIYKLNPDEREAVRKHKYELVRIPGVGWKLDRNPSRVHPLDKLSEYEKFKRRNTQRWNGRQSVIGKIF